MKTRTYSQGSAFSVVSLFLSVIMLGLPLIFTNGYYNITETKAVFYYVCAVLLLMFSVFSWTVNRITLPEEHKLKRLKPNILDISMLAFGIFVFLSGILSQYSADVWTGISARYQGVITVLLYIAVYFAVSRDYRFSQGFLFCCIGALSIVSIIGVLNCFDIDLLGIYSYLSPENKRIYISTIGNINFYSSYMCLLLPLVLCGFCSTKGAVSRVIYTVSLIMTSFGMMVSGSESFVIGFVFSVLVFPFFLMKETEKLKRFLFGIIIILLSAQLFKLIYSLAPVKNVKIPKLLLFILHPAITALLIVICLAVILILHKNEGSIKYIKIVYIVAFTAILLTIVLLFILANTRGIGELNKYFKISDRWGTRRGGTWKQCISLFGDFSLKEKLFGIGPETLYRFLEAKGSQAGKSLDQAHNEYLQYLLTTGIFGLLSYISVIICTSITVVRKLKNDVFAVALFLGLVAFWFQGIVNMAQPFTTPVMYLYISVIGGMYCNKSNKINLSRAEQL